MFGFYLFSFVSATLDPCVTSKDCLGVIPSSTKSVCEQGVCKATVCEENHILFSNSDTTICTTEWKAINSMHEEYFGQSLPDSCDSKCLSDYGIQMEELCESECDSKDDALYADYITGIKWDKETVGNIYINSNFFFFPRLVSLELVGLGLQGELPKSIGNANKLKKLKLGNNRLGGTIPREIGNLKRLRDLDLTANALVGPIPAEIGKLTKLENLVMNGNQLNGSIPNEINNLKLLQLLILSNNNLSGNIPDIPDLKMLKILFLHQNPLTGSLPDIKLSFTENSCILPASLALECVSSNCLLYGEDVKILRFPECSLEHEECYLSDTYDAKSKPCQSEFSCVVSNGERNGSGVCKSFLSIDSLTEHLNSAVENGSSVCVNEICKVECDAGFFKDGDKCKQITNTESGQDFEHHIMHVQG